MGGPGSGRHRDYDARKITDVFRRLDARRLAKAGVLNPGYCGGWQWPCNDGTAKSIRLWTEQDRVTLAYRHRVEDGKWQGEQYSVHIVHTPCNFGGSRAWFICPATGCGRRVAILFGGRAFACRHCHQLAYASSRESAGKRAARHAVKLRKRLGWQPGLLNHGGGKPKWMRWRTFYCLTVKHDKLVRQSLKEMMQKVRTYRTHSRGDT